MTVAVRRIRPEDWLLLKQTRLAALADSPSAFARTHAEESVFSDAEWRARATAWSAGGEAASFLGEIDGVVHGLVGGHRGAVTELVSMWVAPTMRGSGLAAALVDAVIEWAGPDNLELWVTRGNDRAAAFYERCGFVTTDDVQPLPSDPCKDEIRMRRPAR